MSVTIDSQRLIIEGVQSIVVSTIQPDAANGVTDGAAFVRLIQIYTDPTTVTTRRPVLELALYGGEVNTSDQSELEIAVPPSEM